jgi:hypothetical protein
MESTLPYLDGTILAKMDENTKNFKFLLTLQLRPPPSQHSLQTSEPFPSGAAGLGWTLAELEEDFFR